MYIYIYVYKYIYIYIYVYIYIYIYIYTRPRVLREDEARDNVRVPRPRRATSSSLVNLHATPYTLHPTPYTLHPTPYTLHPTPYTLHPTPYTLHPIHPTPCILTPKPETASESGVVSFWDVASGDRDSTFHLHSKEDMVCQALHTSPPWNRFPFLQ